jgi:hypothetical protein
MQASIVLPIHDPGGIVIPFLWQIESALKQLFQHAFVGLTPATIELQTEQVERLRADPFYILNYNWPGSLLGDHFRSAYASALTFVTPETPLHLCDIDRVAFGFLTAHRSAFINDLLEANKSAQPVLFQRSAKAWATYPENYRQIEGWLTQTGQLLFGQAYDFAWSHLCIRASLLAQVLPKTSSRDFGLLIELVLLLQHQLITRQVDWLEWEDPFILGRSPEELRHERESSRAETLKRLRGMLPFFPHFLSLVPELNVELKWEKQ